jgi:hypothetical protein
MSNYSRSLSFLALFGSVAMVPASRAITLPAQTTIPVIFTHTENAAKVKAGDVVTAKTMQVVLLPNGNQLPKGSLVIGHIVEARPFKFDDTDYAVQQASYLSIKIDQVVDKSGPSPVVASVRAMADPVSSREALSPHGIYEPDALGTVTLIGGAHFSPIEKHVTYGVDDDIVAYNKKQGVFAHLLPGGASCPGTQTEQSMGVFSPDACGLYGFASVHLSDDSTSGTFRLVSIHHTVVLYAGSAALLQVQ